MSERKVFVVSVGVDVGTALARGLRQRGLRVALIDEREPGAHDEPDPERVVAASFADRPAVDRAFADAASRIGPPDQVVVSVLPVASLRALPIHELALSDWHRACRDPIKSLLYLLQSSFTAFGARGGSVVALGPALSLAGAERLVALSAAVEGQRGLVKSAARQWGRQGISVNWVAAAPRALSPLFDGLPLPVKPDAVMVALGRGPALEGGLAGVVDFLGSEAGRTITGATLVADGGEWMVP